MNIYTAVKISTTNDGNGNPRRGWYIQRIGEGEASEAAALSGGGVLMAGMVTKAIVDVPRFCGFVNEGYRGFGALQVEVAPHGVVLDLGEITVTPGEYRTAKRTPFNPDGVE